MSYFVTQALYIIRQFPYTFPNDPDNCPATLIDPLFEATVADELTMNFQTGIALLIIVASPAHLYAAASSEQESTATPSISTKNSSASTNTAAGESRWQLGVALGNGLRTNPLIQSDDFPIIVDIDIAWFGDHFFFDNGDLGLTVIDNKLVTASVVARFNSDRVFFGRTDTKFVTFDLAGQPLATATQLSIPDRDYAVEMGIEILADGLWGQLQMTAHHDVSGTHEGYEVEFDYAYGWRNQRRKNARRNTAIPAGIHASVQIPEAVGRVVSI